VFEYHNPHPSAVDCCIRHQAIGTLRVAAGQAVPTPEMEARGVTAQLLEPFVLPSFLRPTPPADRRRLLVAAGVAVPEDVVTATSHLPEFGGAVLPKATAPVTEEAKKAAPRVRRQTRHNFNSELETALKTRRGTPSAQSGENKLQEQADALCSSRTMRPVDPDAVETKPW
jgi:hypothetical protein